MPNRFVVLIFLVFVISGARDAEASEIVENWISARALGMGNAYTAVVDDYNALFYNPAALDKIHGLHLTLLTPQIGTDALTGYQTYMDATGSNYSSIIHNFFGEEVWVGVQDSLAFSMNDFAIAGFENFNMTFNLNNPPYANINMYLANDYGIAGGFGTSLLPNDALRVGFTVKRITRYGGALALGPSTLATLSNSQLTQLINNYGTGYGLDTGMLLQLPGPYEATFSAVWQNIGQTAFVAESGVAPPPMDNDPIIGFSMLFKGGPVSFQPSVDFTHINLDQSEELGLLAHLGLEIKFLGGLAIRGGFNQGYYTAGLGLDLSYLKVDIASYGVELDTYPGQLEDRRYILQVTLDLNFDPHFDLFKSSGSGSNGGSGGGAVSPSWQRR